jgi:hypothetical protein
MIRTYPLPDKPGLGARARAMAVYKLLLNMEPEQAVKHKDFAMIVQGFAQAASEGMEESRR